MNDKIVIEGFTYTALSHGLGYQFKGKTVSGDVVYAYLIKYGHVWAYRIELTAYPSMLRNTIYGKAIYATPEACGVWANLRLVELKAICE